jgi:hypothetical protein
MDTNQLLAQVQAEAAGLAKGQNILEEEIAFVTDIALREPAKCTIDIPTQKVSFNVLNGVLTLEVIDGKLVQTWTPNT